MVGYKIDLYRNGAKMAELEPNAISLMYGYQRNDFIVGELTYQANQLAPEVRDNLIEGSEIRIERRMSETDSYKLVYAGELQKVTDTIDSKGTATISANIVPWGKVFLEKRKITKTYTSTEESAIAWDLIDTTQTDTLSGSITVSQADCGFTMGICQTTGNVRNRTYSNEEILTLLQQIADVQDLSPNPQRIRGFIFGPSLLINNYKTFNYFADLGSTRADVILTSNEIDSITRIRDIGQLATRVTANGGAGTTPQSVVSSSTTTLDFYKLRDIDVSASNISTNATLLEQATDELYTRSRSVTSYSVTLTQNNPFTGLFDIGDSIRLIYSSENRRITIDSFFRIYEIQIRFMPDNGEDTQIIIADEKPVTIDMTRSGRFVQTVLEYGKRLRELEK